MLGYIPARYAFKRPPWQQALFTDFPEFFQGLDILQCSSGWELIIRELCERLQGLTRESGKNFQFSQIKEKFGGIRIYWGGGDPEINAMIAEATEKASRTCEDCGEAGTMVMLLLVGRWYQTSCEKCIQKRAAKRAVTFEWLEDPRTETKDD